MQGRFQQIKRCRKKNKGYQKITTTILPGKGIKSLNQGMKKNGQKGWVYNKGDFGDQVPTSWYSQNKEERQSVQLYVSST